MRRSTAVFTATVLSLGLAATAFAGSASAGTQLSKKEFLKQGNSICKTANQDLQAVFQEVFAGLGQNEKPSAAQQQAALDQAIPIFRGALSDIDGLTGPASLEKSVGKILHQYEAVIAGFEADPSKAFSENNDPFVKPDKAAKKIGLKTCAQNS